MNIGLTGGIATGKSSVSRYLVSLGAILIDADQIAREVMLPGHPVLAAVIERFGQAVLNEDGTLHRKKLGEIVFGNSAELKALNDITHPAIRQEMRERMRMFEQEQPDKLVVSDIPLLYESRLSEQFEQVMVVYVPAEVQLKRLMERDGISKEDALSRLNAQMDIEEKKRRADIVIDNSGSMEETKAQILKFWHDKGLS
ncbi:dephospho-CoA kinase [Paenibacillus provencensis]|uniref:Dephospho-CoA kinase n=1 Tax=Paenibacillus provencensis TaxID=441151 RepID=A0ABW3PLX0_9BACL|nr:dephospho-CoA kinase [Paenibacillus sp. MER 78]MCM3127277.1 dephospho-CoA kinase [Paenibacillus sp. MER 78]